jgi:DCN1-like protein 1/2
MRYFQDLGLNLENAEIFVPLEIVQAPQLAELSKDSFIEGWKTVGYVSYHTMPSL